MSIKILLHSIIARLILFVLICIAIVPVLFVMILPARIRYNNKFLFWWLNLFYWAIIKGSLVPVTFVGRENIPSDQPVIFASNHQSSLDIPLVGVLPNGKPQIWLARAELLHSLLLRFILPRFAIVVDVNSPEKSMRSLRELMRVIKGKNTDVMIFPEGGRFTDDGVHEFFGGFVILAKLLKRPVIPVRIFGANKVYPPNTYLMKYHPIKVVVGKPFVLQENETNEQFKQRVYQWFIEQSEE